MEETKQILTAIWGRLDEMGADIHSIKSDIVVMKADIAVMKSDIAVLKSDVAEVKETQTRHERILELLSIKSIDHEASIRDIRKTQEN